MTPQTSSQKPRSPGPGFELVQEAHKNVLLSAVGYRRRGTRKRQGAWAFFNQFGRTVERGSFHNDLRDGYWAVLDWDKGIISTVRYKFGREISRKSAGSIAAQDLSTLSEAIGEVMRLAGAYG